MALEITETKQPTLFKRGNDDINLDELKRRAHSRLEIELDGSSLTEDEKNEVRSKFDNLLQGMYDKNVTYVINDEGRGSFNNTLGINNSNRMSQHAAYVLGNLIRDADVYSPPEETPDPFKVKWEGNSSIASILYNRLFGDGDIDLDAFTKLDYDPTSKKITGNTKRSERLISELNYILNNYDFGDKKEQAHKEINDAIQLLSNGITENEYLDLGRTLGISGIKDWFGNIYTPTDITPESISEYKTAKYPKVESQLGEDLDLTDLDTYGQFSRSALYNYLNKLSDDWLSYIINYTLNEDPVLYKMDEIKAYNNGKPPVKFSNQYLLSTMLEILRNRDSYKNKYLLGNGNQMYIKNSFSKKRGTVLIYDINGGVKKIKEVNIYDIPEFDSFIEEQMKNEIPSNKLGGVLKFNSGGNFYKPYHLGNREGSYEYTYDPERLINPLDFGEAWVTTTPGNLSGTYKTVNGISTLQTENIEKEDYYKNFTEALFDKDKKLTTLGEAFIKKINPLLAPDALFYNKDNELKSKWEVKQSDGSTVTYNSVYDYLNSKEFDLLPGAMHNIFGRKSDKYYTEDGIELDPSYAKYYVYDKTKDETLAPDKDIIYTKHIVTDINTLDELRDNDLAIIKELWKEETKRPGIDGEAGSFYQAILDSHVEPEKGSKTKEDNVDGRKPPFLLPLVEEGFFTKFADYLMDFARVPLAASNINATNRASKVIDRSLKAPLSGTFEKYVPITGNLSAMLFKNQLAANTMFQAKEKPISADANLASALMMEALRLAKNQEAEGFLIDDQAWKLSRDQALQAQWDNMMRRTQVNNENMKAINSNNRERAYLEASRIKANQTTINNLGSELIKRWEARFIKDRDNFNKFREIIASNNSSTLLAEYKRQAREEYNRWAAKPENVGKDITQWDRYPDYIRLMKLAEQKATDLMYTDIAPIYGRKYVPRWNREDVMNFFNTGWK